MTVRSEASQSAAQLFAGPGEMRARCREFDWAATSLGPVADWSQSLRTTASIVLGSRHPMFLWWGPQLVQLYNDAYRPSFGQGDRHPTALGARGRDFWTDIWEAIGPQIDGVMTRGESTWHEDQLLPIIRNGRLEDVWWTYSYSPVIDDDGSIGGTLVVCQETTRRIRTEQELRESEARYRTLFESLDQGFCVLDLIDDADGNAIDYRFVEVNRAFHRHAGLSDVIGRTGRDVRPGLVPRVIARYGAVAKSGQSTRFRIEGPAAGQHFDVFVFRPGSAAPNQVAVLFDDVSVEVNDALERERLLRELGVERARLADVFRRAPTFLAVLRGPTHVFTMVNDAYYQLVGHRELVGKSLWEALPELRGQGFEELLASVLRSGEAFVGREVPVFVARVEGAPPEERFVNFIYQPLIESDADGTTVAGVIAHGTDVTEEVLARMEVQRLLLESERARADAEFARAAAEQANASKTQFLASMSHELRTPLNAIQGHVQLIDMGLKGPVTPDQQDSLARIDRAQRHLLGLVNDVLNYTRLGSGRVEYERSPVTISDVISDVISMVEPQMAAKQLAFGVTYQVDADPRATDGLAAWADREKLGQVMLNLLSNAIKFTLVGGRIGVDVFAGRDADHRTVSIRVSDSGIGIPADKLDAIFEPFVQVRSDYARGSGGTGLGLAISRDLARGMRGDITVHSREGVGTMFTVVLERVIPGMPEAAAFDGATAR